MPDNYLKPRVDIDYVPYKQGPGDTVPRCSLDFTIHLPSGDIGDELIRLESFQGNEAISQHFEFHLSLRANDHNLEEIGKGYATLDFSQLMGQAATIRLGLPQKNSQDYVYTPFNGIITRFSMSESGVYTAVLRPALWKLTLSNHYRIVTSRNIRDTIAYVLDKYDIEYDVSSITGAGNPAVGRIQDWLQAGESDFDFITRLMQKAHIYFYYIHRDGAHCLVFANKPLYQKLSPDNRSLRYIFSHQEGIGEDNLITVFTYQQNLTSTGVRSIVSKPDAAWEESTTAGLNSYINNQENIINQGFRHYYVFQYGGSQLEADGYAKTDREKLDYSAYRFSGSSQSLVLKSGYKFKAVSAGNNRPDVIGMRPMLDNREFVVTSVQHQAAAAGDYENQFESTNAEALVVDFELRDTRQGTILATVIAHGNAKSPEYIHYLDTDNFAWGDKKFIAKIGDEPVLDSIGVYVRFSTDDPSAEPQWVRLADHMQTVPEVGVTVVISRSNDDSEIPEIQSIIQTKGGRVINPDFAIANTNVGDNYSTSFGDSYSIRFGRKSKADLDSAVNRVESQKRTGKFRDVSYSQGASYSYSTSENGKSGLLSESESYGSTYNKQYSAETQNYSEVDNSESTSIIGNTVDTSTVGTSIRTSITDVSTSTSTTGVDTAVSGVGVSVRNSAVGASIESSVVGSSFSMSATGSTTQISLTGSESRTTVTGSSTSSGITGTSTQFSATGANTTISATGVENHANTVGMTNSASLTGMSNSASLLGMANEFSATGMRNSLAYTGLSTQTSTVGLSVNTDSSGVSIGVSSAGTRVNVSTAGTSVNVNSVGSSVDVSLVGSGVRLTNEAATVRVENIGPDINMVAIKVVL